MFERTRAALVRWDKVQPLLDRSIARADTNEAVRRWEARVERFWLHVSEAFYQDTIEVNSKGKCRLVHPNDPWLRQLVERHKEGTAP